MSNRASASANATGKADDAYENDRERNMKETSGELNMLDTYVLSALFSWLCCAVQMIFVV